MLRRLVFSAFAAGTAAPSADNSRPAGASNGRVPNDLAPCERSVRKDAPELVQVILVMRHGYRTPLYGFGSLESLDWQCLSPEETESIFSQIDLYRVKPSSYIEEEKCRVGPEVLDVASFRKAVVGFGNCFSGQLTRLGHQQMSALGQKLRRHYVDFLNFLPSEWDARQFFVRSSSIRRNVESAFEVIRGMYPKSRENVAIHLYSPKEENIYFDNTCKTLRQLFLEFRYPGGINAEKRQWGPLFEASDFKDVSEYQSWSRLSPPALCNKLWTIFAHNLPFPQGITPESVVKACELSGKYHGELLSDPLVCKLGIGRLLKDIVQHLQYKISTRSIDGSEPANGDWSPRLVLLSGHDSTLAPLLQTLKLSKGIHPTMGSVIAFELWAQKSQPEPTYFVKVMYNFEDMIIPECNNQIMCPWNDFFELTKSKIPQDYDLECHLPKASV
ncbi:counting factor 60-like [Schistocerca gregaria]|uniref:counting factor 60-like n=1 Tax=Schistocerca gregaria TaxID=7010 RepID=UPI00211DFF94|nr:counting factor 60-like [Schistocerca gregaria]